MQRHRRRSAFPKLLGHFMLWIALGIGLATVPGRVVYGDGLRRIGILPQTPTKYYDKKWAVIIGINEYKDSGLPRLSFAVHDADALRLLLRDEFGYAPEHTQYLTDADATQRGITKAFERLHHVGRADSVLVFFAGHGFVQPTKNEEGYIVATDSKAYDLERTAIKLSWMRKMLEEVPAGHKLLILDSCYSGRMFQRANAPQLHPMAASGQQTPTDWTDPFTYYANRPAFYGMSAGRDTPVADGNGKNKHSIFTASLLQVLRERADSPRRDHAFTFRQVAVQVETRVMSAHESQQIPNWGTIGNGDGDFIFLPTKQRTTPSERRNLEIRRRTHSMTMNAAWKAWLHDPTYEVAAKLNADLPAAGQPDIRTFGWYHLHHLLHHSASVVIHGNDSGSKRQDVKNPARIDSVVISPDGSRVAASVKYDNTGANAVRVWAVNAERSTVLGEISGGSCMAFSTDGKHIVIGERHIDGTRSRGGVSVWNAEKLEFERSLVKDVGGVVAAEISAVNERIAVGTVEGRLLLGNWRAGSMHALEDKPESGLSKLVFSADGQRLFSIASGGCIRSWKLGIDNKSSTLPTWTAKCGSGLVPVFNASDGKLRVANGLTIEVVHPTTGQAVLERDLASRGNDGQIDDDQIIGMASSPDAKTMVVMFLSGHIRVVHVPQFQEKMRTGTYVAQARAFSSSTRSVGFTRDGKLFFTADSDAIHLWKLDATPGSSTTSIPLRNASMVAFSSDTKRIASAFTDGGRWRNRIVLWDAITGREIASTRIPEARLIAMDLAPNGRTLAVALETRSKAHRLEVFATDTAPLTSVASRAGRYASLHFIAEKKQIVAQQENSYEIWDFENDKIVAQGTSDNVPSGISGLGLSPDGKRLWTSGSNDVALFYHGTTTPPMRIPANYVITAALSPSGETFVWSDIDRLSWFHSEDDPDTDPLQVKAKSATSIAFSPDGRTVASGHDDGAVLLWTSRGEFIQSLNSAADSVKLSGIATLRFANDGKSLAVVDKNGTILRFFASTDDDVADEEAFHSPHWLDK